MRYLLSFALVLACPTLASAQTGAPSDVSIYVFTKTDPSGFSDPFQAQRLESLETVKVTLKKRKGITVVEQADRADVHIEIINAGKLETGAQRTKGLSTGLDGAIFGTRTTKETKPQVHVVLRASDYQLGIHGTAPRMKYAAAAVGDGVEKWVKRNRKLLAELVNAAGITSCAPPAGSPYVNVNVGADSIWSPGERVEVVLQFTVQSTGPGKKTPIAYTRRVLAGAGGR